MRTFSATEADKASELVLEVINEDIAVESQQSYEDVVR